MLLHVSGLIKNDFYLICNDQAFQFNNVQTDEVSKAFLC